MKWPETHNAAIAPDSPVFMPYGLCLFLAKLQNRGVQFPEPSKITAPTAYTLLARCPTVGLTGFEPEALIANPDSESRFAVSRGSRSADLNAIIGY